MNGSIVVQSWAHNVPDLVLSSWARSCAFIAARPGDHHHRVRGVLRPGHCCWCVRAHAFFARPATRGVTAPWFFHLPRRGPLLALFDNYPQQDPRASRATHRAFEAAFANGRNEGCDSVCEKEAAAVVVVGQRQEGEGWRGAGFFPPQLLCLI